MAVALAHDVTEYFISRGTPVYACSLDAEGAFDSLPHAIMFQKTIGVIPDMFWRILVFWYSGLVVRIRWAGILSRDIRIWKGTRQGGLSSPFMFNTFYKDLVQGLSDMQCGTKIDSATFNVFCYADDLLVTSTTITGLQKLLDYAEHYIRTHGLRFNPTKTQCITFGKSKFSSRRWYLDGVALEEVQRITYLGVTLSNDSGDHSNDRIKSARRAFYALQGAGICDHGTSTETLTHLYQAAIRPVLTYGLVCVHQNKAATDAIEKCQGNIVKTALGLSKFDKTSPLLNALRINSISTTVEIQQLALFRTMLLSSSRTGVFYKTILKENLLGISSCRKDLVTHIRHTCQKHDVSLVRFLCDDKYGLAVKRQIKAFPVNDGVIDSVKQLVSFRSMYNTQMLNLILSPF